MTIKSILTMRLRPIIDRVVAKYIKRMFRK